MDTSEYHAGKVPFPSVRLNADTIIDLFPKISGRKALGMDRVINNRQNKRGKKWTESIAVGEMDFVLATKAKLGAKGIGRKVIENSAGFELKEFQEPYSPVFGHEKRALSQNNGYFWDVSH
jgi:hypothetical protein